MVGDVYQYLDQTVEAGKVYYYWIELVFRDKVQETGPVFAELFFEHRYWLPAVLR